MGKLEKWWIPPSSASTHFIIETRQHGKSSGVQVFDEAIKKLSEEVKKAAKELVNMAEPQEAEIVEVTAAEEVSPDGSKFKLGNKVRTPNDSLGVIKSIAEKSDGDTNTRYVYMVEFEDGATLEVEEDKLRAGRKPRAKKSELEKEIGGGFKVSPQPEVKYSSESHDIKGHDDKKELLRVAINKNMPVLIVGDTGTGKTSIVKGLADEFEQEYVRFNLTGETTVDEFVGKYILEGGETKWEDGILLQAMKAGKWIIVDEINVALPEILFVLHSLLDDDKYVVVANHNGEVVRPADTFRFFGTMNPVDEYAGTKDLNKAFKSRFNMILSMDYPKPTIEAEIIQAKTGVDETVAKRIVDTALIIREMKRDEKVFYTCSTRDLIQWGNLVDTIGEQKAFEVAILGKANGDSKLVSDAYRTVSGHYIDLAKQGYLLNIDEIKKRTADLKKREDDFKNNQDVLREEIRAEFSRKLGLRV